MPPLDDLMWMIVRLDYGQNCCLAFAHATLKVSVNTYPATRFFAQGDGQLSNRWTLGMNAG